MGILLFYERYFFRLSDGTHVKVANQNPIQKLEADLQEAGFRLENFWSSSTTVGLDNETQEYVHSTHKIFRGEIEVAVLAIVPWENRANFLDQKTNFEAKIILKPIIDIYLQRLNELQ